MRGLSALGVSSRAELPLIVPKGLINYQAIDCAFLENEDFCGPVRVVSAPQKNPTRSMWSFDVDTDGQRLRVSFFGPHPSLSKDWKDLKIGLQLHLKGVIRQFGRTLSLSKARRIPSALYGRVIPAYSSVPKIITGDRIREEMSVILDDQILYPQTLDILHDRLGSASPGHESLHQLLQRLHRPQSPGSFAWAINEAKRLSVLAILSRASTHGERIDPQSRIPIDWFGLMALTQRLPFALSSSQESTIDALVDILDSDRPLRALLSGDVGSGKTITYALPAIAAWQAGKRVGILAPNTPLATQIARELETHFPHSRISLLIGNRESNPPNNAILVGTTALISYAKRTGWTADFLVVDEQQKFSLEQRSALTNASTNILEATATCIPHTLGMLKYGGMPVFRLRGHAKKQIITRIVGEPEKKWLMKQVERTVNAGKRVMIIYPKQACDETDHRRNVRAAAERWATLQPGNVALLHGRLSETEKNQTLDRVRHGECPIVIATSIMEVGITIPQLTLGIVVSAERYGISTLHQMRGRLVREGGDGLFLMYLPFDISDPELSREKQEIVQRLRVLERTQDGFELAERDAARRGYGDLLNGAEAQHGQSGTPFLGLTLEPHDFHQIGTTHHC